jgi:hypothetical protein
MDSPTAVRAFDFPPQLDQAEIENRCARESFTWGPQALWLLCGMIWLFDFLVRDVPDVARNTLPFAVGATLLAALAVRYEIRRRRRQTVLYALGGAVGGRIGCYRGNVLQNQNTFQYQYSFGREEMVRVRRDFFDRLMVVLKLLVPMLLLVVIVAVVLIDGLRAGLKQSGPAPGWPDMAVFVYAMLFAIFGFVAFYRSHFRLAFFWIPNGKGKTDKSLYLRRGELRKIEDGDGRAIR